MKITLVMPLFNEGELIQDFVEDIRDELETRNLEIIIVNDNSTDNSQLVLSSMLSTGSVDLVINNDSNLGHGPSVLKGVKAASTRESNLVVTVDSDGQISGEAISQFINFSLACSASIVEGVRLREREPFYRRSVSAATRILVFLKTKEFPRDANTPLRCYRDSLGLELVTAIPEMSLVPNLQVSILSRKKGLTLEEFSVISQERRGKSVVGTTWKSNRRNIPSWRFVKFCFRAALEIFQT